MEKSAVRGDGKTRQAAAARPAAALVGAPQAAPLGSTPVGCPCGGGCPRCEATRTPPVARVPDTVQAAFGQRLDGLRLHQDTAAGDRAAQHDARAVAIGRDVYLGASVRLGTAEGSATLVHEATHVLQFERAMAAPGEAASAPAQLEAEAAAAARAWRRGAALPPLQAYAPRTPLPLREPDKDAAPITTPDHGPPSFGNLPHDQPAPLSGLARVQLVRNGDSWRAVPPSSPSRAGRARGTYDFVVLTNNTVWAVPVGSGFGHTEAALGQRVLWAGRAYFEPGKPGKLGYYSNESGHYLPAGSFGGNATQVMNAPYRPIMSGSVTRPGGRPQGPQLPTYQLRPGETLVPGKVPPRTTPGVPATPGEPAATKPPDAARKPAEPPPAKTPSSTSPAKTPDSDAPAATKPAKTPVSKPAADPPAAKKPAEPPLPKKAPDPPAAKKKLGSSGSGSSKPASVGPAQSSGSGGRLTGAAATAAQRTFSSMLGRVQGKLMQTAAKDPEAAKAIADINKLMDAQAFVQNPKKFSAQYVSNYLINSAFGVFSRQLDAAQAQFFATYPNVSAFHTQPYVGGQGASLDDLRQAYELAVRGLRTPDARKVLVTVFMMLGVNDKTPQKDIDFRFRMINEYLANQPGIGAHVTRYNEARKDYTFALGLVELRLDHLIQQLSDLPADFADDLRRRSAGLFSAADVLDGYVDQLMRLSALPGADEAAWMFMTLSEGFSGIGEGLRTFAYIAGARKGYYEQELARLRTLSEYFSHQHGAFDAINA